MTEFKDTLEVKVGKETFWFRLPGPLQLAAVGSRALELRREASPGTAGSDMGLDPMSRDLYTGMALLETLLVKADAKDNWPFTVPEKGGKPTVVAAKFPPRATLTVSEVSRAFYSALDEFLDEGDADGDVVGAEAVDGGEDVQSAAVGSATPISA